MRFMSTVTLVGLVVASLAVAGAAQEKVTQEPNRPGEGVTSPTIVKEVKPVYTDDAKRERIQGTVGMDVVVKADGTVGNVKVTKSLDVKYGLDEQAVKAVKQWTFSPGTKDQKPVDVLVSVEMSFTLK
jgi:protein TonB